MKGRTVLVIGITAYLLLGALALLFYKERVIILDMAFHTFEIVKAKNFAIQSQRFGAIFTQFLPVLAIAIGASLKSIMQIYSVSFILFPFAVFLISVFAFKDYKIAISIILFSVLIVSHTFYWIQSELIQGCIFLFLYFAFLLKKKSSEKSGVWNYLLLGIMSFLIISYHPLIVFPFMFGILFFWFSKELIEKKLLVIAVGIQFISGIVKVILFPPGKYDHGKMSGLKYFLKLFPNYFNIPTNIEFIKYCFTDYYFLPLILIVLTIFYVKKKEQIKLVIVHAFFWGYLLLVNVSNYNWHPQFYVESYYVVLSIFLILPLAFDVTPTLKRQWPVYLLICLIIIISVIRIFQAHDFYTRRLNAIHDILSITKQLPNQKLVLSEGSVPMDLFIVSWGSSYEFLLLSSLEDPESSRALIILKDYNKYDYCIDEHKIFFTEWYPIPYYELSKKYFQLKDTSAYIKINKRIF